MQTHTHRSQPAVTNLTTLFLAVTQPLDITSQTLSLSNTHTHTNSSHTVRIVCCSTNSLSLSLSRGGGGGRSESSRRPWSRGRGVSVNCPELQPKSDHFSRLFFFSVRNTMCGGSRDGNRRPFDRWLTVPTLTGSFCCLSVKKRKIGVSGLWCVCWFHFTLKMIRSSDLLIRPSDLLEVGRTRIGPLFNFSSSLNYSRMRAVENNVL